VQRRPANDQPAVMAGTGERRPSFVAEPHARGSHSRQQPSLVKPFSPHFRDVTNGMMQCRVIVEEDPRRRGEALESIADADEGATVRGKPRVVNRLKPSPEAHPVA
jgi:hypothetical protein